MHVNPSKWICSIIHYMQNIYCIAICAENTISDNIKNQENVRITPISYMYVLHLLITSMYYIYLLHLFVSSILQCPQGPVGRFLRKYVFKHHVLTTDSESTQNFVKIRTCSSSVGAFCVELWPKQVLDRILVPMSYNSC